MNDTAVISDTAKASMQQKAAQPEKKPAPVKAPQRKPPTAPAAKKPAAARTTPAASKAQSNTTAERTLRATSLLDDTPTLVKLTFGIMVTLDLTRDDVFNKANKAQLRTALTKFQVEGMQSAQNLYNPFRAVNMKVRAKDPTAARGLVRNALNTVLGVASELEGQNITYLGERATIEKKLSDSAEAFRIRIEGALGINQDTIVVGGQPVEEGVTPVDQTDALELRLSDIVKVSAWANTSIKSLNDASGDQTDVTTNLFVNLRINSAALYEAEDLDQALIQIKNFVEQTMDKFSAGAERRVPVLLAVNLRPNAVGDRRILDALVALNEDGWDAYDRMELTMAARRREADWLPAAEDIGTKLLSESGDTLVMVVAGMDEEEEETAEEGGEGEE